MREKLYRTLDTTPEGHPVSGAPPLMPEQRQAIEYMRTIRALTPDVKDVKRASLPASCKFLGDMDKFDNFQSAVEGHYRQQQASFFLIKNLLDSIRLLEPLDMSTFLPLLLRHK